MCTNGSFELTLDGNRCGDINICGYFTNGTTVIECSLACDSVSIACPAITTGVPGPTHRKYYNVHIYFIKFNLILL